MNKYLLESEIKDGFDSVKHVYNIEKAEIFKIRKLENGLYVLESEDNPGNAIVLTYNELEADYMPIELIDSYEVKYFYSSEIFSGVDKVLSEKPPGLIN